MVVEIGAGRAVPSMMRLSMYGVRGQGGAARPRTGSAPARVRTPSVDPARSARAASRCRTPTARRPTGVGDDEGEHSKKGGGRVAAQGDRDLGQPVADPGSSAGPAEHGPPVVAHRGLPRTSTGRSSGRRPRSAGGWSRSARRAARPRRAAQPRRRLRSPVSDFHVDVPKSAVATPAQAERAKSADLALSSTCPVGWSWRARSPVEEPR